MLISNALAIPLAVLSPDLFLYMSFCLLWYVAAPLTRPPLIGCVCDASHALCACDVCVTGFTLCITWE
jgi:hypothetical protein